MKNKLYISLFAAAALGFASCESDIDNFMVDDTIGLLNSGLVETEVYTGLDETFELYAVKAGKGRNSATATIAVDPTIIDEYNELKTTKQPVSELPADCYDITVPSVTLYADDYRKPFVIKWNVEKLQEALATDPNQVVPLRMSADTDGKIGENRLTALVKPSIDIPTIEFQDYNFTRGLAPTRKTSLIENVYKIIKANFIAQEDIEIELAFDEELIKEYNDAHSTSYVMLPDEAFEMESMTWTLKKHLNSVNYKFTFLREYIIPTEGRTKYGSYMLPIRIVSAKSGDVEYNVTPGKDFILYTIDVEAAKIDKSKWTVVSASDGAYISNDPNPTQANTSADYGFDKLFDDTAGTTWRSVWSVTPELPLEIVIDLGVERDLYKIGFENPTGSNKRFANTKAGYYAASLDGETFVTIGEWELTSSSAAKSEIEVTPVTARYVKFVITKLFTEGKGTTLGEISMWGE